VFEERIEITNAKGERMCIYPNQDYKETMITLSVEDEHM